MTIEEHIRQILAEYPNGVKARFIARNSKFDKSDINSYLYGHPDDFYQNQDTHEWFINGSNNATVSSADNDSITNKIKTPRTLEKLEVSETDATELKEKLLKWRTEIAKKKHIPSYYIAKDETFEEIAHSKLSKCSDLKYIKGIGETNYAKYGTEIFEIYKSVYYHTRTDFNKIVAVSDRNTEFDDLSF